MTHDVHVLMAWIRIFTIATAVCATAVPVIYSFSPWRSRRIGQLFMFQAVSFAAAIDFSAAYYIWHPTNVLMLFWTDVVLLAAIAASTSWLGIYILILNHPRKRRKREIQQGRL